MEAEPTTVLRAVERPPRVTGYSDLVPLGDGGFATVYGATQDAVGRRVALKVLRQTRRDELSVARFERECTVVGELSWHPHIAALLDAGFAEDDRHYLVFELVPGGSLADRIAASGPLAWPEALEVGVQVADALAAAHEAGVLHRDVKPANILIDRLGSAKLADFGIAQVRDERRTLAEQFAASLAHAAPEVVSGAGASEQSDVYMLASTLFELIAGHPPFGRHREGGFFAMVRTIISESAPRLDEVAACPRPLADLIERCLAKEPGQREPTARDFGLALRSLQHRAGSLPTRMPFVDARSVTRRPEPRSGGGWGRALRPVRWAVAAMAALVLGTIAATTGMRMNAAATPTGTVHPAVEVTGVTATGFQSAKWSGYLVDGDLTTSWMSPPSPRGEMLMFDFGRPVRLSSVRLHQGELISPATDARGLGAIELRTSDGAVLHAWPEAEAALQVIEIDRTTTSLTITVLDDDPRPLVIREVEFDGGAVETAAG